jgi:hypothetical protein
MGRVDTSGILVRMYDTAMLHTPEDPNPEHNVVSQICKNDLFTLKLQFEIKKFGWHKTNAVRHLGTTDVRVYFMISFLIVSEFIKACKM